MVDYEAASKAVEKARPNRGEAARQAQEEAEKEFRECSQLARYETNKIASYPAIFLKRTVNCDITGTK